MPGITGIVSKTLQEKDKVDLQCMVESMMHEPFYASGTYVNEQIGVCAGWVCHEGSFSDCMPVWNEKKNIVMIFFGENFTDLDLFDLLKAKHHRFDNSNASYIVHLYEEYGVGFLQMMNGWFSGILIDLRAGKIILFNDRYALQRIFYYESKKAFYFASEAKALLKACPELREIDPKGLGEMISCNCTLEHRALFKNVFLLPGSAAWCFEQDGSLIKDCYFEPETWENQPWLEKEFFYERLKETVSKILPRYFRSTQKIGISLTGGLDTRVIMANMDMPAGKYPCYTFGGMYRDCYDVKVARKVAETCQQAHNTLYLDKQFLDRFQHYAEKTVYISDGYFDVSNSYEIYLNNKARDIASVRITGNYGGEILRGIEGMLRAGPFNEQLYSPDMKKNVQDVGDTVAALYRSVGHPMTTNLFREIPLFRNHGFVCEQSQLTPRTPYLDNDLVSLMYRFPVSYRKSKDLTLRLIRDGNRALGDIPTDRGVGGNATFPMSSLLKSYYEFLFKAEYAYNYGMPQWLAKIDHVFMAVHLERMFLGRHKFAHFRLWYRDELADYIKSILLDNRSLSRPYLNRQSVEKMVQTHTKGDGNYTTEITKLLKLELIQRLFVEGN